VICFMAPETLRVTFYDIIIFINYLITKNLIKGQIGRNLVKKQTVKVQVDHIKNQTKNQKIADFIDHFLTQGTSIKDSLLDAKQKLWSDLTPQEQSLLTEHDNIIIYSSTRASFNSKGFLISI